jgi:hypothetical protein
LKLKGYRKRPWGPQQGATVIQARLPSECQLTIGCRPDFLGAFSSSLVDLSTISSQFPNRPQHIECIPPPSRLASANMSNALRAKKRASTEEGCIVTGRQTRQVEMSNLSFIIALRSSRSAPVLMMLLSQQSSVTLRAVRNADSE